MKRLLSILALMSMVLVVVPAHAASERQTYVANGLAASKIAKRGDVIVSSNGNFTNTGDPISVRVVDQSGPGAYFKVCQEGPATETEPGCGNGDDVVQNFCATGGSQTLSASFRAPTVNAILVFIEPVDDRLDPLCTGLATTGTVTLYW